MHLGPSLLFCPADRPERYSKAADAADTVIIDLEDAVAAAAKDAARNFLIESTLNPGRTIVRLNPRSSGYQQADLRAVRQTGYTTVMLAKAETADDLEDLDGLNVIALCESPLGIRNAGLLADLDQVCALTWGAEDLVAAMGGNSSRFGDGRYRDFATHARSSVLIAASSSGKAAYDTVCLDIADEAGLAAQAEDAAASGFAGSMCIHPRQVEIIRRAYRPTAEAVQWAREILEAAASSANGVFVHNGQMVDEPVIRQARHILTR